MRVRWLLAAGGLLVGGGLLLPPAAVVGALNPGAAGESLEELLLGVWLFKALLVGHGVWLLVSGWRRPGRAAAGADDAQPPAPLWQPDPETLGEPATRWMTATVLALLGIAAVLRWAGIHQDLWHDEVFTLIEFVRPPLGRILTDYSSDNQHLLFSVLAHLSIRVFGESAAALRLPAVLLGLASLWATLRLGRLVSGHLQALPAAALLTFSYHHVWFCQNARGYTGLLLATVLASEMFLRGLWRDRWGVWIGYASVAAAGMALHLTMVFVIAAHGALLVWIAWRSGEPMARLRRPIGGLLLSATLTLQAYALVLPQMLRYYLRPGAGVDAGLQLEWKSPVWMINEMIRGLGVGLGFGWLGLLGGGLLFAIGLASFFARGRLTTACFLLPAVLGGATMVLLGRNLWPRFFFNSAAFGALLAVRGAWVVGAHIGRRIGRSAPAFGAMLAALLVVASAVTLPKIYRHPKQDFTGALRFVEERRQTGDRVVALDLAASAYRAYYAPGLSAAHSLEELGRKQATAGRTWVLYTLPEHLAATRPALWREMQDRYELVRVFPGSLSGGAIVVRRTPADNPGSDSSGPARGGSAGGVADELAEAPEQIDQRQ